MHAADYGIWLQHDALRSRKSLAQALRKHFDSIVSIARDGAGLRVIFIDREQVYHVFDDAQDANADKTAEPERNWTAVSQRVALVLVS